MKRRLGIALATLVIACLLYLEVMALGAAMAGATTLVNDPAHPFTAEAMARMQGWVDGAHVPTVPGEVTVTNGAPDGTGGCGAAGARQVWLVCGVSRFALLHELGHEAQFYLYPQSTLARMQVLTGFAPGDTWQAAGRSPVEVGADAYAECAMRTTWRKWWVKDTRRKGVLVSVADTATPYDFRAGPKRFARICAEYRTSVR